MVRLVCWESRFYDFSLKNSSTEMYGISDVGY